MKFIIIIKDSYSAISKTQIWSFFVKNSDQRPRKLYFQALADPYSWSIAGHGRRWSINKESSVFRI